MFKKALGSLTVYFSDHEDDAISEEFSKLLHTSDILVLENASYEEGDPVTVEHWNNLTAGIILPEDMEAMVSPSQPFKGFERKLMRLLYRSRKRIELEKSPLTFTDMMKFFQYIPPPDANSLSEAIMKVPTLTFGSEILAKYENDSSPCRLGVLRCLAEFALPQIDATIEGTETKRSQILQMSEEQLAQTIERRLCRKRLDNMNMIDIIVDSRNHTCLA